VSSAEASASIWETLSGSANGHNLSYRKCHHRAERRAGTCGQAVRHSSAGSARKLRLRDAASRLSGSTAEDADGPGQSLRGNRKRPVESGASTGRNVAAKKSPKEPRPLSVSADPRTGRPVSVFEAPSGKNNSSE
jgi:hypothetical protein